MIPSGLLIIIKHDCYAITLHPEQSVRDHDLHAPAMALSHSSQKAIQAYLGAGWDPRITPAIVIGLCKHGLYLTRNFAAHGIPVIVLVQDFNTPSAKTRHGYKIQCTDLHGQPLINTLRLLQQFLPRGVPVFATNDRMVDNLLHHFDELSVFYRFPFPGGDIVARLKDKGQLHALAVEAGLRVPQSHLISNLDELDELRGVLKYPVAVKPALPMMSFKSQRCDDFTILRAQAEKSIQLGEQLIIQEWIEGDDRAIVFGAYYLSPIGNCLAKFSGHKLMSYPPLTGHASAAESWDIGVLLEAGSEFIRRTGYWGLCSIEYKGTDPKAARFIEVTVGRCDWWIMCCGINGVNIPMAAYNDLTGHELPYENEQRARYIWYEMEDVLILLADILANKRWPVKDILTFVWRKKRDALFDLGDPLPFIAFLPTQYHLFVTKIIRRLRFTGH